MYFDCWPNIKTDHYSHRLGITWWGTGFSTKHRRLVTKVRGRTTLEIGPLAIYIGRLK